MAAGSLKGHKQKVVVIACYVPPNYKKQRGQEALECLGDVVVEMRRKFSDPYLAIGGDFNQWTVEDLLDDFADVSEVEVGATRGGRSIDRLFFNVRRSVTEAGTLDPLETEDEKRRSDHSRVLQTCPGEKGGVSLGKILL